MHSAVNIFMDLNFFKVSSLLFTLRTFLIERHLKHTLNFRYDYSYNFQTKILFFWCETSILMVLLEELFRTALTFTHTHTERMGSSVFHVSMVIQRCSKTFPLVCCSLNVKTAQSFTHTHIVQEEMCEVCSGCQEFLSQMRTYTIFQFLTTVVATLTCSLTFCQKCNEKKITSI